MDALFAKYERELVMLRALCREYAQRYPKVAARLQLGGEACDDPHVERMIQAVALLGARIGKRLDDSYPQLTEALLNLLYPHYLRPFPSCAVACIDMGGKATAALARGTVLHSAPVQGVPCGFRTVYELGPAPARLLQARFDAPVYAPLPTRLPDDASAAITLTLALADEATAGPLRLYIDGEPTFAAALRDTLFLHTAAAYLQVDGDGPWERLPALPVMPVGFADDDALIPYDARSPLAYRILAEFFAFPEKFNFIDIDVDAVRARLPQGTAQVTLHLVVTGIAPDSDRARVLDNLNAERLLAGCTPVVNLFRQAAVPITVDQYSAEYTLLAHGNAPQAFDVYAVERVQMVCQSGRDTITTDFRPFYALRHSDEDAATPGRYWIVRHDDSVALCSPGHEKSITLVDTDCQPLEVERTTLSVELTCTNRDLPCALRIGAPEGDLFVPGGARDVTAGFLRRPTRPARLVNAPDADWRLISHLALNHHSLMHEGAAGLREMLTLYDLARTSVSRRQIAGIVGLEQRDTTAWIRHRRGTALVHGIEVRVTLDEEAFVGAGLGLFVQVLDHFLALYVNVNSFVELVVLSQHSGKELVRCPPRSASTPLA